MTPQEAAFIVVEVLDALRVPYMLVGSLSSSYFGIARSTKDADFVVQFADKSITDVAAKLGEQFRLDPQMSYETVTMTSRHVIEILGTPFKIEFFRLSDDPHDQKRFERRCSVLVEDRMISLPTAEDVIITKLRWTVGGKRSKDWDDVRNVIAVQGDRLDWPYIHHWCEQHGTRMTLDEIRASIPPI